MRSIHGFSAFLFFLLLSCSSAKNATDKKIEGKSYNKLFIIANTADIEARVRLEKALAGAAESKGYMAVKSIDVIPPVLSDPKPPSQEELVNKVKATGCDALCIIYFLKNKEGVTHTPGVNFKGTEPVITGLVAMLVGIKDHNNNFRKEDDPKYKKDISDPGFYTKEKGFYIVSELFDAASKENIYSEQSESFDEVNLAAFSTGYMTGWVNHMEAKKILKK